MLNFDINILEWGFQFIFFCLLLTVLIYARRLNRLLQQVRDDYILFKAALIELDTTQTTTCATTDRVLLELRITELALTEASGAAEAITRKLDDVISKAAQLVSSVSNATLSPITTKSTNRVMTSRVPADTKSRAERDLARMLLDASS
jgi:hypothetical protein